MGGCERSWDRECSRAGAVCEQRKLVSALARIDEIADPRDIDANGVTTSEPRTLMYKPKSRSRSHTQRTRAERVCERVSRISASSPSSSF